MNDPIRKILLGLAGFAALAFGGAQLAGAAQNSSSPAAKSAAAESATATPSAQAEQPGTETADDPSGANEPADGNEANEPAGKGDGDGEHQDGPGDKADQVTGAAADQASKAALAKVSGKVTEVSAEHQDGADPADKADANDPAYESKIAYDVEVTKADGSKVDVHLDKSFNVLGTDTAEHGD